MVEFEILRGNGDHYEVRTRDPKEQIRVSVSE